MPVSNTPSDRPDRGVSRPLAAAHPAGQLHDILDTEGIEWEGAIFIKGQGGDIPAWLTATRDRIVLSDDDVVLLEAPRSWLVPAPLRVHEQQVRISITPEGVVPGRTTTERLLVDIQKGREAAQNLVAMLTGRARKAHLNAELPTWRAGAGAGASLPPLPAFESVEQPQPSRNRDTSDPEVRGASRIDAWDTTSQQTGKTATRRSTFSAPDEEPVEHTSSAARFLVSRSHGPSVPDSVHTDDPDNMPANVTSLEQERSKRAALGVWSGRIAMLLVVALIGSWFARDYLPTEVTDQLPAFVTDNGDLALNAEPTVMPTSDAENGDGTLGAGANPEDIMPTEVALGVGGGNLPTETVASEPASDEQQPELVDESSDQRESAPANEEADAADADVGGQTGDDTTDSDAGEPADTEQSEASETGSGDSNGTESETDDNSQSDDDSALDPVPTEAPVDDPIVVEPDTEDPTPEPTSQPDGVIVPDAPATEEVPNDTDETADPESPSEGTDQTDGAVSPPSTPTDAEQSDDTAADSTPEPEIETPEQEQALESQPPSVSAAQPAAQQFEAEGIRYSVEGASSGASLPDLPEVNEVTYGEWVVLAVEGENWTEQEQVFDMREFSLLADGQEVAVDVGNAWVASLFNYMPAYGNTDATLWAPGESHDFVLTFLAPPEAQSLLLRIGDQQFDLRSMLDRTPRLNEMRQGAAPETIDATVVDVIDGETIVIEKDGVQQTVRYLGIDVPGSNDCYSAESLDTNRSLVAGRSVKIERQATDVDARGNWVRDVWVQMDDGRYVLVSHQLVEAGAATADISEPNTRFASWLRGAEAAAQAEGRGLWGACQSGSTSAEQIDGMTFSIDHRRSA